MELQLDGKTAVVSGSTAGIGYAVALGLAEYGAHVVVTGRTQTRVDDACANLSKAILHAKVSGFAADLTTAGGAKALVAAHPSADILINNLGIFEPRAFEDVDDAEWLRFFESNVLSGVRLTRAYLPGMRERDWGRVIFVSSESGLQIPVEIFHYGVTKTAQIALARGVAESLAGTGVTVNSVLPGPTKSEGVGTFLKQMAASQNVDDAEMERRFFRERPAFVAPEALHHAGRSSESHRLLVFARRFRDDRLGAARRRRRGARHLVTVRRAERVHARGRLMPEQNRAYFEEDDDLER